MGRDIAELSLEELSGLEVTSVSRRGEPLGAAPASIYVITADAIRRSGVTSLPEALRLAPNLQVARIDATQYAISARGFNNAIGNKLLVLIDGRTVYTPFFSGVFWDQQDVLLDDVERIEVISGPGATLWGANAVNGVINILTRSSAETEGTLVAAGAGNRERGLSLRHGVALGESGHLRVYGKTTRVKPSETAAGTAVADGNERHQAGLRADWVAGANTFTVQGDAYRTRAQHRGFLLGTELTPIGSSGANVLGRWTRRLGGGGELRAQAYLDHMEREDALLYRPTVDLADLELQHAFTEGRHKLVWGGGYRRARDELDPGLFFGFVPRSRTLNWGNLFVQDDVALTEALGLTLGVKLEHNDFTGLEPLPNLRLAWRPSQQQMVWGAFSRAVRAPARLDRDIRLPPTPPYIIAGGPDFVSEVANVFELGWRAQLAAGWSGSATAFLSDWKNLRSGQTPPNAQVQNMIDGQTYGLEAWASWQVLPAWRLSGGFTTLHKHLHLRAQHRPGRPPQPGRRPVVPVVAAVGVQPRRRAGVRTLAAPCGPPAAGRRAGVHRARCTLRVAREPRPGAVARRAEPARPGARRVRCGAWAQRGRAQCGRLAEVDVVKRRLALYAGLHAAVAGGVWMLPRVAQAQGEGAVAEYQVKAAYLYKFLDFVEWPAPAFDGPKSPFVIGVTGADVLVEELDALIARRRVESRPVLSRRLRPGEAPTGVHVLFVGRGAGARAASLLAATAKQPVLTVTEVDDAPPAGSTINFVTVDRRVRFDVALRSAETRELKISSRLLGVARRVEGAP